MMEELGLVRRSPKEPLPIPPSAAALPLFMGSHWRLGAGVYRTLRQGGVEGALAALEDVVDGDAQEWGAAGAEHLTVLATSRQANFPVGHLAAREYS